MNRPSTHLLMGNHDSWFAFGLPDEHTLAFHAAPYDPDPLYRALEDRRVPARDFILRTFLLSDDGPLTA